MIYFLNGHFKVLCKGGLRCDGRCKVLCGVVKALWQFDDVIAFVIIAVKGFTSK